MTRLTRRQFALNELANAPLDREIIVPAARVRDPNAPREHRLQSACIKLIRDRQKIDKRLAFMAPGATQNNLTPAQRAFAKSQGWQSGLADIWLMRQVRIMSGAYLRLACVELKLPGKSLSDEQSRWFEFLSAATIPCHRCDNISDFASILENFCGT